MKELNLKGLGEKDKLRFQKIEKEREKIIEDSSSKDIHTAFLANALASNLHPKIQHVIVEKIIEENEDTKTFILGPDVELKTKSLAYFQAGQSISLQMKIGKGIYRRPYTISCSPKHALHNHYAITVKRVEGGIVSNCFLNQVNVGDKLIVSAPFGEFYYQPLRDSKNVIAIAGGSGITPFLSMAEAIYDGTLDFHLTILYGAKNKNDLIFKDRFDVIMKKCKKVKVVYILSEEEKEGYEFGYIDERFIDPFYQKETSFFVCGPIELYKHINQVLKYYDIEQKYIRHDAFMSEIDLESDEEYNLTVLTQNEEVKMKCNGKETLLASMERFGIITPSRCHVGECGFCRSKLVSGKVKTFNDDVRIGDKNITYIHPCSSYPESDIVLKLPN